ncbi:helix-turn-helix domain-containing protein [Streptomyces sp. NPDC012389]|uniref:helix-turn-helix domain-containing protein n=1 Tax=Streptomyces sp. NPDC012389 TaxID=3364830 RepID=UPI0036F0F376
MPRARREEQILAAAMDEFGRHGHASASMAAIAGRVGVTKPMLYTYFGSTELHTAAHRRRRAIDDLAASGTADLLRGHGNDDPLDADALKHVWTGAVGALVGRWTNQLDRSAHDMAARCARLLTAIRD